MPYFNMSFPFAGQGRVRAGMPSTVAIDARMVLHSGIGTYLRNLLQGLIKSGPDAHGLNYRFYGPPALLSKYLRGAMRGDVVHFDCPIYSLKEHWKYARLKKEWDLWHSPHFNVPMLKKGRLVVTVHDLIHLVFRREFFNAVQGWYVQKCFAWVRKNADAVIAVSHHTKKDLVELAGVPAEKITVIHEGVSQDFRPMKEPLLEGLKKKYRLDGRFLLFVGNIKPHKNVGQLIRALRTLKLRKAIQEDLVLVGRVDENRLGHDKDILAARKDPCVRFLSEVPPEDLPGLYNLARAVVLPSLYEGFGLVVLEAMACGTPVVVSNRASLPEIAGEAAEVFEPEEDSSLMQALEKVTQDEACRAKLIALGLGRAKQFSWERMVEETQAVYERAIA